MDYKTAIKVSNLVTEIELLDEFLFDLEMLLDEYEQNTAYKPDSFYDLRDGFKALIEAKKREQKAEIEKL